LDVEIRFRAAAFNAEAVSDETLKVIVMARGVIPKAAFDNTGRAQAVLSRYAVAD